MFKELLVRILKSSMLTIVEWAGTAALMIRENEKMLRLIVGVKHKPLSEIKP